MTNKHTQTKSLIEEEWDNSLQGIDDRFSLLHKLFLQIKPIYPRLQQEEWIFIKSRTKKRLGDCQHSKKTIRISKYYLKYGEMEDIKNTFTHELAHALLPGERHSKKWKQLHKKLGGDGKRCKAKSSLELFGEKIYNYIAYCKEGCYKEGLCRLGKNYRLGLYQCPTCHGTIHTKEI